MPKDRHHRSRHSIQLPNRTSPPTPSPADRRRQAHRCSSLLSHGHQEATNSTAFKLSGLGANTHTYPTEPTRHSLFSLSNDPSHNPDFGLTWRTSRQTDDPTTSLYSLISSDDGEDFSAADSSVASSDDSSVEFDMVIDLASPPPMHSLGRGSVQNSPLTLSGLSIASPPPTIVPLCRRDGLQHTPKRSCKPDCSCRIERDSCGRAYHEDALMLASTNETYESPREREWGGLQPGEGQMIFPRLLWGLLNHPSPLVASNVASFTPQAARAPRKCAAGKRDPWEDEGNPFLLTKYDFTPYCDHRPGFKTADEEESPVEWSPPSSPSIRTNTNAAPTRWYFGTQFGLGISLDESRLPACTGLGLGLLS